MCRSADAPRSGAAYRGGERLGGPLCADRVLSRFPRYRPRLFLQLILRAWPWLRRLSGVFTGRVGPISRGSPVSERPSTSLWAEHRAQFHRWAGPAYLLSLSPLSCGPALRSLCVPFELRGAPRWCDHGHPWCAAQPTVPRSNRNPLMLPVLGAPVFSGGRAAPELLGSAPLVYLSMGRDVFDRPGVT
jgi:hypothetical protein